MKHFTAEQLARMKLPGYPKTREGWRLRAISEAWEYVSEKSRGRGGLKFSYFPPKEVLELIEKQARGDLQEDKKTPTPLDGSYGFLSEAAGVLNFREDERPYNVSRGGPPRSDNEINSHLMWLCLDACIQVYGKEFESLQVADQLDYSVDLYNLLARLSAAKRSVPNGATNDFDRLDAEDMATQLRLFVQLGWVKRFPPSRADPKQLLF